MNVVMNGQEFAFPYSDLFRPLTDSEYEDLKADIQKRGVIVPIIVNESNEVLDGQHRLKIAHELGIPHGSIPFQVRAGLSENAQAELAYVLNLHRRHFTKEERVLEVVRRRKLGWSTTKIAEAVGVSHPTVIEDLQECSGCQNLQPEQVTGTDSKSYPATKPTPEELNARQERVKAARAEGASVRQIAKQEGVSVGTVAADLSRPAVVNVLGVTRVKETSDLIQRAPHQAEGYTNFKDLKKTVTRSENREKRLENLKQISTGNAELSTEKTYPIILADPPWRYQHQVRECDHIENHYPTMSLEEICCLPVAELATDPAVLFMWVTSPKAQEAMQVLEAWGFTYKTQAIWDKEIMGMGYWFRQQHELVYVATRGNFPPPSGPVRRRSVYREKKTEHSVKPAWLHDYLEEAYPELNKIELFARSARPGWDVWGNQSNG